MKKPTKFVHPLTENEKQQLATLQRDAASHRTRCRAHAILLSDRGVCLDEIALIFEVTHRTASAWLDRWSKQGRDGLLDNPRCGRTPKLSAEERQRALQLLKTHPHQPRQVLAAIKKETGKQISRSTLKRLARKARLRWKRTRRRPGGEPDPECYALAVDNLADLHWRHDAQEVDLFYLDATGFSLTPNVGYAWQPIGERIEIPSRRSKRINVLGLWSPENDFTAWTQTGSLRGEHVADCLNEFSHRLTRETWVVMDNAPIHLANVVWERAAIWESRGLNLLLLPEYSPELNLIERLWRRIKYHWLPLGAYETFEKLWDSIMEVLNGIGSKYELCLTD